MKNAGFGNAEARIFHVSLLARRSFCRVRVLLTMGRGGMVPAQAAVIAGDHRLPAKLGHFPRIPQQRRELISRRGEQLRHCPGLGDHAVNIPR